MNESSTGTSAAIRRVMATAAEILTYGLDGRVIRRAANDAQLINADAFFEHLYVPRESIEKTLDAHCGADKAVWMVGPMGSGKTSLAYRVLRAYNKEHRLPLIAIDFRVDGLEATELAKPLPAEDGQPPARPEINDADSTTSQPRHSAEELLTQLLLNKVLDAVAEVKLPRARLAARLLDNPDPLRHLLLTPAASDCYQEIADKYYDALDTGSVNSTVTMRGWAELQIAQSPTGPGVATEIQQHLKAFGRAMGPAEVLLSLGLQGPARIRPIVLIDNLDSLSDIRLRSAAVSWLRMTAERLKDHAQFFMCVRPDNYGIFVPDSKHRGSLTPADDVVINDEGTHLQFLFNVRPEHLPDEALEEHREHFAIADPISFLDHLDTSTTLDNPYGRQLAFDSSIISKRLKYVEQLAAGALANGDMRGIDSADLRALASALRDVLAVRSIRRDTLLLSNGNRRFLFAMMVNFIEYIVDDLNADWDTLGSRLLDRNDRLSPRLFTLFSLYYRWIAKRMRTFALRPSTDGGSVASAGDKDAQTCFDPTFWVDSVGWNGNYLTDAGTGLGGKLASCMCPLYTLLAIYNLCGNDMSHYGRKAISLYDLINQTDRLRLPRDEVLRYITMLLRAGPTIEHGLLECSHFNDVLHGKHKLIGRTDEHVLLTDRGARIIEATGAMYSFLASRLHAAEAARANDSASPSESDIVATSGLVTLGEADAIIRWLRRAITCEIHMVYRLSGGRRPNATDIDNYKTAFCISRYRDRDTPINLWSHRMVKSCLGYLTDLEERCDQDENGSLHNAVQKLRDLDRQLERKLHSTADWDQVPRDRAFGAY